MQIIVSSEPGSQGFIRYFCACSCRGACREAIRTLMSTAEFCGLEFRYDLGTAVAPNRRGAKLELEKCFLLGIAEEV